jgi:hypothetical protein
MLVAYMSCTGERVAAMAGTKKHSCLRTKQRRNASCSLEKSCVSRMGMVLM